MPLLVLVLLSNGSGKTPKAFFADMDSVEMCFMLVGTERPPKNMQNQFSLSSYGERNAHLCISNYSDAFSALNYLVLLSNRSGKIP